MSLTNREGNKQRASKCSLYALDSLNFLMADVRDGVGPFLSAYLKGSQHWGAGQIGIALAMSSIVGAICQIPSGLLVDSIRAKRSLVALSAVLIGAGCLSILAFPSFYLVLGAQGVLGAASAVIPPALAAISLGLVGLDRFPSQFSRNEGFNHGGNFALALLASLIGQRFGYQWIFFLACFCSVGSICTVGIIRPNEIDHGIARGGQKEVSGWSSLPQQPGVLYVRPVPLVDLFKRTDLVIFLISVFLFHFGNAAMLPMAGQVLAKTHPGTDIAAIGACIISAQLVMVGVAASVGRALRSGIGRRPIFMVALIILPIRGILFSMTDTPMAVVAIQLLDGVAAGIFGVISVVIASDLMRGTGRFNLAQGLVALATGLGASVSNVVGGLVAQTFGYSMGFITLTSVAITGLVFFAFLMPETGSRSGLADQAGAMRIAAGSRTND